MTCKWSTTPEWLIPCTALLDPNALRADGEIREQGGEKWPLIKTITRGGCKRWISWGEYALGLTLIDAPDWSTAPIDGDWDNVSLNNTGVAYNPLGGLMQGGGFYNRHGWVAILQSGAWQACANWTESEIKLLKSRRSLTRIGKGEQKRTDEIVDRIYPGELPRGLAGFRYGGGIILGIGGNKAIIGLPEHKWKVMAFSLSSTEWMDIARQQKERKIIK